MRTTCTYTCFRWGKRSWSWNKNGNSKPIWILVPSIKAMCFVLPPKHLTETLWHVLSPRCLPWPYLLNWSNQRAMGHVSFSVSLNNCFPWFRNDVLNEHLMPFSFFWNCVDPAQFSQCTKYLLPSCGETGHICDTNCFLFFSYHFIYS